MNKEMGKLSVVFSKMKRKWVLKSSVLGILKDQPGFDNPEVVREWAEYKGYVIGQMA